MNRKRRSSAPDLPAACLTLPARPRGIFPAHLRLPADPRAQSVSAYSDFRTQNWTISHEMHKTGARASQQHSYFQSLPHSLKRVRNSLKMRDINTPVFTLMRTLLLEVLWLHSFTYLVPGVYTPTSPLHGGSRDQNQAIWAISSDREVPAPASPSVDTRRPGR
jgi:hypothetical protein